MAMNWVELVNNFIQKGTVERAAIFHSNGSCLASTNSSISSDDVMAILRGLNTRIVLGNKTNFGLFIENNRYVCFKADDDTVIGHTVDSLFVANRCDDVVILAFVAIKPEAEFSCLGEVWTFAQELRTKMEISAFIG